MAPPAMRLAPLVPWHRWPQQQPKAGKSGQAGNETLQRRVARRQDAAQMGTVKAPALLISLTFLAACGEGGDAPVQAQRISLDDARAKAAEPIMSPDTTGAVWTVTGDGQAIDFARADADPWLTLACDLREAPATLA